MKRNESGPFEGLSVNVQQQQVSRLRRSCFSGSESSISSLGYCAESSGNTPAHFVPTTPRQSVQWQQLSQPSPTTYRPRSHSLQSQGSVSRSIPVHAEDVATRLKTFNEIGRAEGFLADEAWFKNPLVKIEGDSRVIKLGYGMLKWMCEEVTYDVNSCYAGSKDSYFVEADVTYTWKWPLRCALKPLSFHLFDSVHIRDATDDIVPEMPSLTSPGFRSWQCYKIEQVWDASPSIGSHFVTAPIMKLTAFFCYLYDAVILFFAVLFGLCF